ncbi:MAG: class A beta-lactamase [Novosphingobium sp.]|jgi:beta-lactamase class A|nr:class A beta-lactamase [Novosphingobium sp.]
MAIFAAVFAACAAPLSPASADDLDQIQSAFDSTFGTGQRAPRSYPTALDGQIAALADAQEGRIGVAALDLATGRTVTVLGSQPFPMASTSKIAIVATFLDGVDRKRFSLTDRYPLMVPVPSRKFDGPVAPVRAGTMMSAQELIELALTRSDNSATDALLAVIGGPKAVNNWVRRAGLTELHIDRDIATLVRDDGAVDPARTVDTRDAATPMAMVRLLSGLYRGEWLSDSSRAVLLGAMERCHTGASRIRALLPEDARVAHKTGTLYNTASDVGFFHTPDGRVIAVAIYVTGQGGKPNRNARIAAIARALYDGYAADDGRSRRTAALR